MIIEEVKWDVSNKGESILLSNGDLTSYVNRSTSTVRATEGRASGKWYWEVTIDNLGIGSLMIGVVGIDVDLKTISFDKKDTRNYLVVNGKKYPSAEIYGEASLVGDVVGVALDKDTGTLSFYRNGVFMGISHSDLSLITTVFPSITSANNSSYGGTCTTNFGNTPFVYSIPHGYKPYDSPRIVNKSFILSSDGYNKLNEGSPAVEGGSSIPILSSDIGINGTVISSGFRASDFAWHLFDNKVGSFWQSDTVDSGWVGYSFNNKIVVNKYKISVRNNLLESTPKDWFFEGSDNSTDWTVLDSRTGETGWVNDESRVYEFNNTKSFSSYRLRVYNTVVSSKYPLFSGLEIHKPSTISTPASWKTVSATLPTLPQFQSEGMKDLSPLDRKVQPVLESPQQMTSSVLGEGKVFKGAVNLQKYFDLRKVEVK